MKRKKPIQCDFLGPAWLYLDVIKEYDKPHERIRFHNKTGVISLYVTNNIRVVADYKHLKEASITPFFCDGETTRFYKEIYVNIYEN